MKKFLKEFKEFALRGNVLDMAIGIIIGGAFTGIVTSLTENFINPLLNVIFSPDANAGYTVLGGLSNFLTVVVNFIITAFVLFCLLRGINKLLSLKKKPEEPKAPTTKKCPYCKTDIAIDATRCPNCTSELK
ncbi:MAG: large conductance mechanosensitive channel protein MscL [Clostridia bacterium]|nr:large conductance mechanosensitive channel protein MscL [Clostridia bacterium]